MATINSALRITAGILKCIPAGISRWFIIEPWSDKQPSTLTLTPAGDLEKPVILMESTQNPERTQADTEQN